MNLTIANNQEGTRQNGRIAAALAHSYVSVEERSLEDLLRFVQKYSHQLDFINLDNQVQGNWATFFSAPDTPALDAPESGLDFDKENSAYIQAILDYMESPEDFSEDVNQLLRLSQPHLVLLLTFLQLLRYPQQQFNQLTQRHLDFYYREVLRLTEKPAVPDQVHAIIELEDGNDLHVLQQGTLFEAGSDSNGVDLQYALDTTTSISIAQVAQLRTLSVGSVGLDDSALVTHISPRREFDESAGQVINALGFKTLGREPATDSESTESAEAESLAIVPLEMGFAITSPLLLMEQGNRRISVRFFYDDTPLQGSAKTDLNDFITNTTLPFDIFISTAEAWIPVQDPSLQMFDRDLDASIALAVDKSLVFNFSLDDTVAAITAPLEEELLLAVATPYPLIKFIVDDSRTATYNAFKALLIEKISLSIEVKGLDKLKLSNDSSVLAADSPFEPFTSLPQVGHGLYFSNQEISHKQLDSLTLEVEWMALPADFNEHYLAYANTNIYQAQYDGDSKIPYDDPANAPNQITDNSFTAQLKVFDRVKWLDIDAPVTLFTDQHSEDLYSQTISYGTSSFTTLTAAGYGIDLASASTTNDDPLTWRRYFKLELESPDFQHDIYPLVVNETAQNDANKAAKIIIDYSKNSGAFNPPAPTTVYFPYTPQIKSLVLDYSASMEISLQADPLLAVSEQQSTRVDKMLQLHPFGSVDMLRAYEEGFRTETVNLYPLLPQFADSGYCYIGLQDLQTPQNLSLLFQMVAGSSDTDLSQADISWHYLSEDRWTAFDTTEILTDSTNGLLDSGIMLFSIPSAASVDNHLLAPGYHWLRARVSENAASIADLFDLRSQALSLTFEDQGNAADHLSKPLAAENISGLVQQDSKIKTVVQPYSSIGGRREEASEHFNTRVSERLRHKQRVLSSWDYERLVLEQFPQIYKVKCINQVSDPLAGAEATVRLIVIANISNNVPFFPTKPRLPLFLLTEIKDYLARFVSPFVNLEVKNPQYQTVRFNSQVLFKPGFDSGFYLKQIREDIQQFLTPWAYDQNSDIVLGGSIAKSTLVQYMESRPYTDVVASLRLIEEVVVSNAGDPVATRENIVKFDFVKAATADTILVAGEQVVTLLSAGELDTAFEGIGFFAIGVDFYVG